MTQLVTVELNSHYLSDVSHLSTAQCCTAKCSLHLIIFHINLL